MAPGTPKTTTVLFKWKVSPELQQYLQNGLKNLTNVNLIFPSDIEEENLLKIAPKADIIVGWRPSKELLTHAKNLRLYINPGAGVQHLLPLFREVTQTQEITLVNGHGNSYFTAQHAVSLLLTLTNRIIPHHQWLKNGKWRTGDKEAKSVPLRDRTIGLLGYGAVNQKVHRFLAGFDVEFAVLKRSWQVHEKDPPFLTSIHKYTPDKIDSFLEKIDTLIIAVPQTQATENLLTKARLEKLGPNGILINMARGSVINEEDLFETLINHRIFGAAIDVWYEYSPDPDENAKKYPYHFPFHTLDNVILSPHRGASPFDDLRRWDEVIENITRFSIGKKPFLNEVNLSLGY